MNFDEFSLYFTTTTLLCLIVRGDFSRFSLSGWSDNKITYWRNSTNPEGKRRKDDYKR